MDHEGEVVIESSTVMYGGEGPSVAHAACLLPDGRRTWANLDDPAVMEEMTRKEFCGRRAGIDGPGNLTVARRGFEGEALEQVAQLSDASIDVMAAGYKDGWSAFDALSARFAGAAWMSALDGTTIGAFLGYPRWLVRMFGPRMTPARLEWDYTSARALDVMADRGIPSAWFIAADDRSAPNRATIDELRRRMESGESITMRIFEETDHGVVTYQEQDGMRRYGNYHPEYICAELEALLRLSGGVTKNSDQDVLQLPWSWIGLSRKSSSAPSATLPTAPPEKHRAISWHQTPEPGAVDSRK